MGSNKPSRFASARPYAPVEIKQLTKIMGHDKSRSDGWGVGGGGWRPWSPYCLRANDSILTADKKWDQIYHLDGRIKLFNARPEAQPTSPSIYIAAMLNLFDWQQKSMQSTWSFTVKKHEASDFWFWYYIRADI